MGAEVAAVTGALFVEAGADSGFSEAGTGAFDDMELVEGAAAGALVSVEAEAALVAADGVLVDVAVEAAFVEVDVGVLVSVAEGNWVLCPASSTATEMAARDK